MEDHNNHISINILANQTRKEIYQAIKKYPGITINRLKILLNIGSHQILYHLGALLEFNQIKFIKFNRIKAFGLNSVSQDEIIIGFYLIRDNIREIILQIIYSTEMCTLSSLNNILDEISHSSLSYCLNNLLKVNLLELKLVNQKKVYFITERKQKIATQILAKFA